MANQVVIRQAIAEDYDAIADVMFDAVRYGRSEYTEEQRWAWVPQRRSGSDWNQRLESQTILVATLRMQVNSLNKDLVPDLLRRVRAGAIAKSKNE